MSDIQITFEELESLARSDGWVQGLARRLVVDASLAEDVVQEAYLIALSSKDRPLGSLGAWLSGVVRNVASSRLRDDRRRRAREERGARPEAQASTVDRVARLELQDLLIRTLLALDEPFREALILRHVEGLAPRQIAAQLDVKVATVNSRISRGLERLREKLDASHEGDRSRWLAAFTPLLIPTSKVSPILPGGLFVKYKLITSAAAVALALFVGSQLLGGDEPAPRGVLARSDAQLTLPTSVAETPSPSGTAGTTGPREVVPTAAALAGAPSALASSPESVPVTVTLRSAATREALPGATLTVASMAAFLADEAEMYALTSSLPHSSRKRIGEAGRRYVADESGQVVVPLGEETLLAFAESGELRLTKDLSARHTEVTWYLGLDRAFEVRVQDAAGRVLGGIPVQLSARAERGVNDTFLIPVASAWTTAGDGLGRLVLTQEGVELNEQYDLVVSLGLPLSEPVFAYLDRGAWPSAPIELVLPGTGVVAVYVHQAGKPVPDGTLVRIARARGAGRGLASDLLEGPTRVAPVTSGIAHVELVGLGAELMVGATAPGGSTVECQLFDGPRLPGEVVAVDLDLQRVFVPTVGQLRDPDGGVPQLDNLYLEFGYALARPVSLDAEGKFELELELHPDDVELRLRSWGPFGERAVALELPSERADGLDLGEIVLPLAEGRLEQQAGPTVEGRVLDAAGKPVVSASLRWVTRSGGNGEVWIPAGGTMAFSTADGQFVIPGELPAPDARLEVRSSKGWLDPVAASVPSAGLVLQLQESASLVGRLELGADASPRSFSLGVWDERQGVTPNRMDVYGWQEVQPGREGFRFEGLRPGVYTLRAEPNGDREAAVVVPGIVVRGAESRDARLEPLDLAASTESFHLRVVDEAGAVLSAALYAFRGGSPEYLGHTDRAPFVLGDQLPEAYVVEAEGYFPVSLDPADLPASVTLERGLVARLEWAGDLPLEALSFQLQAELVPAETEAHFGGPAVGYYLDTWSPGRFFLGAEAPPRVRAPGPYELRVRSYLEDPPGIVHSRQVALTSPAFVMVDELGPVIDVAIDMATLDQEAAWLRSEAKDR